MSDAVDFHIEGLGEAGEDIPEPSEVTATFITVAA
jgi:predicted RNase H-like HicB family nuclease